MIFVYCIRDDKQGVIWAKGWTHQGLKKRNATRESEGVDRKVQGISCKITSGRQVQYQHFMLHDQELNNKKEGDLKNARIIQVFE